MIFSLLFLLLACRPVVTVIDYVCLCVCLCTAISPNLTTPDQKCYIYFYIQDYILKKKFFFIGTPQGSPDKKNVYMEN